MLLLLLVHSLSLSREVLSICFFDEILRLPVSETARSCFCCPSEILGDLFNSALSAGLKFEKSQKVLQFGNVQSLSYST